MGFRWCQLLGHNLIFYCKNVLCKQIIFAKFATSRKNSKYWSWYMEVNVWICLAFIVYWKQCIVCMIFGKLDLSIRTWYLLSSNAPRNISRDNYNKPHMVSFCSINQLNICPNYVTHALAISAENDMVYLILRYNGLIMLQVNIIILSSFLFS